VTLVSVLAVAVAACSSTPVKGAGTTTTAASSSTTAAPSPQDQATANAVVLHASDLPGSWKAGAIDPNNMSGDPQVSRCLGIPDSDPDETAYTGSPVFTQNSVQITSQTTVYTTAAVVQRDLAGSSSAHAATCVAQLVATEIPDVSDVRLATAALPSTAGTLQGFRLTGSFVITQSGNSQTASVDEVALAKGRIEVAIDIVVMNGGLPTGLMDAATTAIARQLAVVG
jgi:hypothetical protein